MMTATLASVTTRLEQVIGSAVDSATWTSTIKTEAIRLSLDDTNTTLGTSYTISSLDSANVTTLPDNMITTIAVGAAYHSCLIRLRQISENPALPATADEQLRNLAQQWNVLFAERLDRVAQRINPTWGNIGLS